MEDVTQKDKLLYVKNNMDTLLPKDYYIQVISMFAGNVIKPDLEAVLEEHINSVNEGTGAFLASYIPIALLNMLDLADDYKSEQATSVAFSECKNSEDLQKILSLTDMDTELSNKGLSISSTPLVDYIKNKTYFKDLDLLYALAVGYNDEEAPKSTADNLAIRKEAEEYYSSYIGYTVDYIIRIYEDIFASGYEVVQPYGVLSLFGCETLNGANQRVRNAKLEIAKISKAIVTKLDLSTELGRTFDVNTILGIKLAEDGKTAVGRVPYYPQKMLEYALGRSSLEYSKSDTHYPVDSDAFSWKSYSDNCIRHGLTSAVTKMTLDALETRGWLKRVEEDIHNNFESADSQLLVDEICKKSKIALTSCVLLSDWKTADGAVIGFKFRVVDMFNKLPMNRSLIDEILETAFSGNVPKGSIVMPVAKRGECVKEYSVQFNAQLCEAEPLFAFKALDSMQRRGIKPSWDNLLLGKYEDDSILSSGDKRLHLKEKLCHLIIAGSRSGKGVMTLNILASAIASKKPIFYLDRKPDMASLLKKLANGRMFVINGSDYQAKYDADGLFSNEALAGWDKHIPEEILKVLGGNRDMYTSLGDLFYFRAIILLLGILDIRVSNAHNTDVINKLGGKDGIVIVIDELTNTLSGLDRFMSEIGLFFSSATKVTELRKRQEKAGDDGLPLIDVYSTAFVDSFCKTLTQVKDRVNAGWHNNVENNDVFILGQDIKRYNHESPILKPTKTAGIATGQDSFILQNMFINMHADGFFGYNANFPNYLNAGDTNSKASAKLTNTARNFAYVPSLNFDDLGKVIHGDKVTSDRAVYFKPFLILNEHQEESPSLQDFRMFCDSNKVSYETVKNMNGDGNGNFDPRIGFAEYIKSQSPDVDIVEVLGKSYEIANYVVQKMGYTDGDCLDFVFDLRPEWMLTVEEIRDKFSGKNVVPLAYGIFKEFAPNLLSDGGGLDDLSEDEQNVILEQREENSNLFNQKAEVVNIEPEQQIVPPRTQPTMPNGGVVEDDPLAGRDDALEQQRQAQNPRGNEFNEESALDLNTVVAESNVTPTVVSDVDIDESYPYNEEYIDETVNLENTEQEELDAIDESLENQSNDSEYDFSNPANTQPTPVQQPQATPNDAIMQKMLEQEEQIRKLTEMLTFMQQKDMQDRIKQAQEKVSREEIPQERILSEPYTYNFLGKPFTMQRYDGKLAMGDDFMPSDDFKSSARMFRDISIFILNDIESMFGGLDRITEFAVLSNALIFNSTAYSPQLPDKFIKSLPLDVQNDVRKGRFAWIFDFSVLRQLPNLTSMLFNDVDFVFKKVRIDLGKNKDFEPKDFFGICPNLMYLQIEELEFSRQDMSAHDDVFHTTRRSTEIMDNVDSWGINATKSNWNSVKSIYSDPQRRGIWKALSVTAMTGATVATGAGTLGLRAGRKVGNVGRKLFGSAKEVWKTMKENSH